MYIFWRAAFKMCVFSGSTHFKLQTLCTGDESISISVPSVSHPCIHRASHVDPSPEQCARISHSNLWPTFELCAVYESPAFCWAGRSIRHRCHCQWSCIMSAAADSLVWKRSWRKRKTVMQCSDASSSNCRPMCAFYTSVLGTRIDCSLSRLMHHMQ